MPFDGYVCAMLDIRQTSHEVLPISIATGSHTRSWSWKYPLPPPSSDLHALPISSSPFFLHHISVPLFLLFYFFPLISITRVHRLPLSLLSFPFPFPLPLISHRAFAPSKELLNENGLRQIYFFE